MSTTEASAESDAHQQCSCSESVGNPTGRWQDGEVNRVSASERAGTTVVTVAVVGTAVIVAAGVLGALSEDLAQSVVVPVSAGAAAVGIVAFVWSYLRAVGRSRVDEISVSQLYVVVGTVAPPAVKRRLQWSLWLQIAVAIVVMVVGFSRTDPEEFNWAACIIVAPLFGMGMNGVWVAAHGTFGARIVTPSPRRRRRGDGPAASGRPTSRPAQHDAPGRVRAPRGRHPLAEGRPPKHDRSGEPPRQ